MSIGPRRLLGFAFASADLLLEISPAGAIDFAMGAVEALSGSSERALLGHGWRDFIDPIDEPMVAALFEGLESGRRGGPIVVRLKTPEGQSPRAASLAAFRLPENQGAVSCALSRASAEAAK